MNKEGYMMLDVLICLTIIIVITTMIHQTVRSEIKLNAAIDQAIMQIDEALLFPALNYD